MTTPGSRRFLVTTDTASLAVFDEAALSQRLADAVDWWTVEADLLAEVNAGNVLVCGLWSDGVYLVEVRLGPAPDGPGVQARLATSLGRLFVVEAGQLPGDGLGPDLEQLGGGRVDVEPGTYLVTVAWGPGRSCSCPEGGECEHPDVVVCIDADTGLAVNRFERDVPDLALPDG